LQRVQATEFFAWFRCRRKPRLDRDQTPRGGATVDGGRGVPMPSRKRRDNQKIEVKHAGLGVRHGIVALDGGRNVADPRRFGGEVLRPVRRRRTDGDP
jgi:hypothetical protein